jgi:predicted SprT family Zn-dependent metalloprotease
MNPILYTLEKTTDSLWFALCESYPRLIRFDPPKIVINNRFTKTAGCNYQQTNIIHVGGKFFAKNYNQMFQIILPHEIAHQADYNLFGLSEKKCGHGKNWAKIMVQLGLPADKYHSLTI